MVACWRIGDIWIPCSIIDPGCLLLLVAICVTIVILARSTEESHG